MPIYNGSQKLKDLYVGGQKLKEVWTWTGTVWQKLYSAIKPRSGMEKTTTQGITTNSTSGTANTVTGWSPLPPAEYPATVIDDNTLVMNESGNVSITATATISSVGSASHSRGIHLRIDGTNVASDSTTVGSQTAFGGTWTGSVTAGQRVGLAAWVTANTAGYRNLTAAQIIVTPT